MSRLRVNQWRGMAAVASSLMHANKEEDEDCEAEKKLLFKNLFLSAASHIAFNIFAMGQLN